MGNEFILDADTSDAIDLSMETRDINPTKDIEHSILEPMKIEPLKIPKMVVEQMMASYDDVCVNDFKDIYHMPEEERKRTFQFYEVFKELNSIKIKHRNIRTFVEAYRVMMKVLNTVADVNFVYDKDVFIKKVLNGKIKVNGLKRPKYIGRGKKDINWELVTEYILNPELDPSDLEKKSNEKFFEIVTEEDIHALEKHLGVDIDTYTDSTEGKISFKDFDALDIDEDDLSGENVVIPFDKKEQRKIFKSQKVLLYGIKDARRLSSEGKKLYSTFAFDLTQDAFDEIRERDEKTGRIKIPLFKGNALNSEDLEDYIGELESFEREHTKVEINGRMYSMDDADEIQLKQSLESNGFDIRKFYSYKEDEKKMKKARKRDEKKIKRLKKNLELATKRYEERDSKGKVNRKKKKKSKKSKKSEKNISNAIKNKGYNDFEDYVKSMESWD